MTQLSLWKDKNSIKYLLNLRYFFEKAKQQNAISLVNFQIWLSKILTSFAHHENFTAGDKKYQNKSHIFLTA